MTADSPDPSLDPIEALKHIRVMIEAGSEAAYGTPCEATFREVLVILDKALPRKPRRKPTKQ